MDQATIDRLFEEVKTELIPLVEQITAKKMPENPTFHAYADPDAQRRVQWLLLDYIGFCRDAGAVGGDGASVYDEFFFKGCACDEPLL